MNTLLISYDLNKPIKDYAKLLEKLRTYSTFWHNLDSFWLVETNETPRQMRDTLVTLIDADDELLVINVKGDGWASHGFSDKATKWLKDQVCS